MYGVVGRALRAFVSIAGGNDFGGTTRGLSLATPTIVGRVGSLRGDVNTPLFRQAGHNVHLAPTKRSFLGSTGAVLQCAEGSVRHTRVTTKRAPRLPAYNTRGTNSIRPTSPLPASEGREGQHRSTEHRTSVTRTRKGSTRRVRRVFRGIVGNANEYDGE